MVVIVVMIVIVIVIMVVVVVIAVVVMVDVPLLDHGGPPRPGFMHDAATHRQQDGRNDQAKECALHDQDYRGLAAWKWRLTVGGPHLGKGRESRSSTSELYDRR